VIKAVSLFQNKIKELEEKLDDERQSRFLMQSETVKVNRCLSFTELCLYEH